MKKFKIAGINFDHMHMGDLLREVTEHPNAEIVAIADESPARMAPIAEKLKIPQDRIYSDYRQALEKTQPDLVILCPSTAQHADWVEKVAPFNTHILLEKPFAASLAQADRIIAAMAQTQKQICINWPLRWYPTHVTAKRLIDENTIGPITQVHYYDGNRGPLRHVADKEVVPEQIANSQKSQSWWYHKSAGGGSLLDYLGYGTTLGTWFFNGRAPIEITAALDQPDGLEVDEHAIVIARYDTTGTGLSKYETRWGTFTDPWMLQPQPKCGFVIVGKSGTISSYDHEKTIRVQTRDCEQGREVPVDKLESPYRRPIEYFLHCLDTNQPIDGPLSTKIARIGQQIVDTAMQSAQQKRTLALLS